MIKMQLAANTVFING